VKQFFVAKNDLALRKVYMLVQDEKDLVQKHDALEDARMLCTVVEHLHEKCKPEDKETIMSMPSQPKPWPRGSKVHPLFIQWERQKKWEATTGADKDNWVVKATDKDNGAVMYFPDWNIAALWLVKYIARNVSPKREDQMKKIISAIQSAPQTGKCRYNCYWEYNPEGAIKMVAQEVENG
jgi:DNA polymerase III epsilon subunit-like protein